MTSFSSLLPWEKKSKKACVGRGWRTFHTWFFKRMGKFAIFQQRGIFLALIQFSLYFHHLYLISFEKDKENNPLHPNYFHLSHSTLPSLFSLFQVKLGKWEEWPWTMLQQCLSFSFFGTSNYPEWRVTFFTYVLITYLSTLLGNSLIIILIHIDPCLHNPMYFFPSNLSFLDLPYRIFFVPQALLHCFSAHPYFSLFSKWVSPCSWPQQSASYWLWCLWPCGCYQQPPALFYGHEWPSVCLVGFHLMRRSLVLTAMLILLLHLHFSGANVINHFVCETLPPWTDLFWYQLQ